MSYVFVISHSPQNFEVLKINFFSHFNCHGYLIKNQESNKERSARFDPCRTTNAELTPRAFATTAANQKTRKINTRSKLIYSR